MSLLFHIERLFSFSTALFKEIRERHIIQRMNRYDKRETASFTLGTTLTFELLLHKKEKAKRVYINEKQKRDDTYRKIVGICKENAIPVIENNQKIFKILSEKENTMIIGEFEKYEEKIPQGNHLVLVNPMNQGNLGTIIRSAAAFEIDGIAIVDPSADLFDPKVVRSSMGALFRIPFHHYGTFEEYRKEFPSNASYPFMLQARNKLGEAAKKEPYSLIFGNEAKGLPLSFLDIGTPLFIEQGSKVDSLNLDNAVSIGLYAFSLKE